MDWGRISPDYHKYRSGPPTSFYVRLKDLGIGRPGQRILDLGTGTGILARDFARSGARVAGVDSSLGQIEQAKRAAAAEGLSIDFRVAPAESTPFDAATFEAVTANQCWHLLDSAKAFKEAARVAAPGGRLAISDFFWVSDRDPVAARSEALILKYNPQWTGARWNGGLPAAPQGDVVADVEYLEPIPFTRDAWRGRVRTCRAIGPTLGAEEVAAFDAEHERLLEATIPEKFEILHRVIFRVYRIG